MYFELCSGCRWNLVQDLRGFEGNGVKASRRSCDNDILTRNCIKMSCLQLFAVSILNRDYEDIRDREPE